MKLLYATSIDLPSTRANRLQVTSMSRAFHRLLGDNFILGLQKNAGSSLEFPYIEMPAKRSYHFALAYLRLAKQLSITDIYCREEKLLFFLILGNALLFRSQIRFWYELHHLAYLNAWWHRFMLGKISGIVSITAGMRDVLIQKGFPPERVLVAPDAVDPDAFLITENPEEAKQKLSLPPHRYTVVYAGTIDEPWKGAGVLYEAAKLLGNEYGILIVGGKPHYVEEFRRNHPDMPNVHLRGHRPHAEIPLYLRAADVLVLPNSGRAEISRTSTSPMKLFEYMAAQKPIVASGLPSIREILTAQNAILVTPDDPEALAKGIREACGHRDLSGQLAKSAREEVMRHTWDARAAKVRSFILRWE